MKYLKALLLLAVLPVISHAGTLSSARDTLTNWGLAYCINAVSNDKVINIEAQYTMGAYFQRGAHDSEEAYDKVRKYFSRQLPSKHLVDRDTGKVRPFVTCMELLQTAEFKRLIIKQDKHVHPDQDEK
ncbi:hypothetical protein [Massilia agri]|uniref:Uncharacterized protein n=1 Tax=Massilia agri TaxID=1886785 RepID=A0ABT2API9_9BURK|nr:hypothetical protein [Massilia agri]MCS0598129.1 hypothetical protein [Massilia agri]